LYDKEFWGEVWAHQVRQVSQGQPHKEVKFELRYE
jgi:hypothetical protein